MLETARRSKRTRKEWTAGAVLLPGLLVLGCARPEGLRRTPEGDGPKVIHDMERRPFPEIPFPNDLGTRLDKSSPTGRRINVGVTGSTRVEREVRRRLNRLDGFGTFAPITVSFDAPLDLDNIIDRHQKNLDLADDAVYLINIDPKSPDYGRPVLLDMGRGNYPATIRPPRSYHPSDPRSEETSLLFETAVEDRNGNGRIDPGEDTDNDSVLDRPNIWPPDARVVDGLLTFYELQSNTLILRPLVPLRERSEYAVVLTDRLLGRNGEPVRSPFAFVHHLSQTERLRRLEKIFADLREEGIEISMEHVAFAWVFTTQTVTAELVSVREGLYGYGPLSWLDDMFPPDVTPVKALNNERAPDRLMLVGRKAKLLAEQVIIPAFGFTEAQGEALLEDMDHIDYLVQGSFTSPDFLSSDEEYIWDWAFDIDMDKGKARVQPATIHFTLVVPKTTNEHGPPFPVAVYAHGFGMARMEFLGFAPILARYGIASVGIDAWGHGLYLNEEQRAQFIEYTDVMLQAEDFGRYLLEGRARDLDGDGDIDPGGDTFSAYAFHARDAVRQSVIDHLQLVRALRGFDGQRTWELDLDEDGQPDLAGDFNGDGIVDAGGPDQPYFIWGSSMGGIHTGIIGALEPSVVAAAPVAGGGALTHLTARSEQRSVMTDTVMRVLGPVIVGEPVLEHPRVMSISYVAAHALELRILPVAELIGVQPGYGVLLENVTKGEEWYGHVDEDLRFSLPMKADWEDLFTVTVYDQDGNEAAYLDAWPEDVFFQRADEPAYTAGEPLASPAEGWGLHRGSPDFRRLVGLAQTILEPGDPINYARHFFEEPLEIRPEGARTTNLLILATLGDPMNPMDIHGAFGRAAGVIEFEDEDLRYGMTVNDWLISNWVYEGICGFGRFPPNILGNEVLFDPDALDRLKGGDGNGFHAPSPEEGNELRVKISTPTGISGIRFAHMQPCGKHSFFITDPSNAFNIDEYLTSLAGHYFASGGTQVLDDLCHEDSSCPVP